MDENQLKIPKHVAIIMDGNGRWAKSKGLPRVAGHKKGMEALRRTVIAALELGISHLTLFGFSTENWKRSDKEVRALLMLLKFYLSREVMLLHSKGVKVKFIGEFSKFPKDVAHLLNKAQEITAGNSKLELNIALSYGGRMEIIETTKKISDKIAKGIIALDDIDEALFSNNLQTAGTPDPDILIRTSGEERISNFLLWQIAYSELVFTETLWPDFSVKDMNEAIEIFNGRERRYGGRRDEDDEDDSGYDLEAELKKEE